MPTANESYFVPSAGYRYELKVEGTTYFLDATPAQQPKEGDTVLGTAREWLSVCDSWGIKEGMGPVDAVVSRIAGSPFGGFLRRLGEALPMTKPKPWNMTGQITRWPRSPEP